MFTNTAPFIEDRLEAADSAVTYSRPHKNEAGRVRTTPISSCRYEWALEYLTS